MKDLDSTTALPGEGGTAPHRVRRVVVFLLKYVVGISLIAWMFLTGKLDFSGVGVVSGEMLGQLAVLMVVQTLLAAVRVRYILAYQGIRTGLIQCLLYNCSGVLYSAFLPGGISGDAVRAYLFMKAVPDHKLGILGAMFLDRVLGLLSMVTLGFLAALYMAVTLPVIRPYLPVFAVIFVVLVLGLAVVYYIGARQQAHHEAAHGRIARLWAMFRRVVSQLRIHHYPVRVLVAAVLQSMLIHLTAVAVIFLCSVHSRAGLGFLEVFVATPIGLLVNAIPLSPGGLGIGENAFEILYRAIGGQQGATSFLLARIFLYSPALVGLVYIAQRLIFRKRDPARKSP